MIKIINARYIKSIASVQKLEQEGDVPEISFVGRSNVGKSSLINTLTNHKIARTSSRPGATRMINIYKITYDFGADRGNAIFSDFPGFGYARVSRTMALEWQKMIEGYLKKNSMIKDIIWLLDIRRNFDGLDEMLLEWLLSEKLPFTPVLTKVDKETQKNIAKKKQEYEKFFEGTKARLFSAKTGFGKKDLLDHIGSALHNVQ